MSLLALRLAVGWHFFREGADKQLAGNFTSVGFLKGAKGPLAPLFRSFVWDADAEARLDKDATLLAWDQYREQVIRHYGFDDRQAERAQAIYEQRKKQLEAFFRANDEDIRVYLTGGVRRLAHNRSDPAHVEVTSLRGQAERIEREINDEVKPWLDAIETIRSGYERDLNALATAEQARRGPLPMKKPARKPFDTVFIDRLIPWFDLIVGGLLIVGLFTRLASLAGAGFLAMIVATQWPGAPGAAPTYYQVVEMFALLVLAAAGAGRFCGLDFFAGWLCTRCFRKTRTERRA